MEGEGKGCIAHRSHRGMLENKTNTVNTTNELEILQMYRPNTIDIGE